MADGSGIVIRVKTEALISAAGDVEGKIRQLEQAFRGMEQIVEGSRSFWEGEGVSAHMRSYRKKMADMETIFRRFRENVTDLQTIADVYEKSEQRAVGFSEALSVDMIV